MTDSNTTVTIVCRLQEGQGAGLKVLAKMSNVSQTKLLNKIIDRYLNSRELIVAAFSGSLERSEVHSDIYKKVDIFLSEERAAQLKATAAAVHMSLEGFMRLIIDDYLEGEEVEINITIKVRGVETKNN